MTKDNTIEFASPHEVARLLNLVRDGRRILKKQGRTQRGIDGYTLVDLENWEQELTKLTDVECEFADGEI